MQVLLLHSVWLSMGELEDLDEREDMVHGEFVHSLTPAPGMTAHVVPMHAVWVAKPEEELEEFAKHSP